MTRIRRKSFLNATTGFNSAGLALAVLLGLAFGGAPPSAAESVRVKYINDGDTVQLVDGRPVRYIGVNAPEIDHARQTAQPFGLEARALNLELVANQTVRLEYDLERLDNYGRTLSYVFLRDGSMVNEQLLQSGLAFCLLTLPNVKYEDRLLAAQRAAMRAGRGMWKGWREESGRFVGNRNSRRFHLANCPEAKRIAPRNRILFVKRWDAFWAGYSPSRECLADFPMAAD
jgi:micrococcal nuclease